MKKIESNSESLRRSYQEKDLVLFQEIVRHLQRKQDTETLLKLFLEIQGELREEYLFELIPYQLSIIPALLKSGKLEDHIAWYGFASFWGYWVNYPEIFDHLVELAKNNKGFRELMYEMSRTVLRHNPGEGANLLLQGTLKAYFPTKELRAAFITGGNLYNIRENSRTPKWQKNTVTVTEDGILVTTHHRSWSQDWETKKYKEEKKVPVLLYKEEENKIYLPSGLPWDKPKCIQCAELGGVWEDGKVEGSGKCPLCKKKYQSIYGVITSPAFDKKKDLLDFNA